MFRDNRWTNPNNFFLSIRCTKTDHAKSFVEKGQIKFNTPQSWVDWEISNGSKGRGDLREGTIAYHHILDLDAFFELSRKYKMGLTDRICVDERVYIKRKRSMNLPTFCIYTLKNHQFECPCEEGVHKIRTLIPPLYFRDFAENMSKEQVDNLPSGEKPALVIIRNFNELKNRLINKLIDIGLRREEILDGHVCYTPFNEYGINGWCDFGETPPMELFIKDESFSHQSESRIILNTNDDAIMTLLREKPIEIGPLDDIAEYKSVYLHEGAEIIATVSIQKSETDLYQNETSTLSI